MKKILSFILVCAFAVTASAMPARPGFRTVLQADGTTIEVQKMGDEFYHYTVNREGQEVKLNKNGIYEVVGEAPSSEQVRARRAQSKMRRAKKDVGSPNLAPRGLLILANFSDVSFNSENTKAVMDSLVNAKDCQVNNGFGSAAQYFRDQSNGQYQPVFDVYGPVTLSKGYKYYGENGSNGDDQYATDAVIEACLLANQKYADLDFTKYNSNGDQYVDFVYVIYAGKGEADTEEPTSSSYFIWPHNYSIQEIIGYGSQYTKYSKADTKVDGLYLDNYAMSQELDGRDGGLAGNGTFCHEFGHVIGLPDFYDTKYSTNYKQSLTPGEWDIMDGGGYNGDGHCPPNYSAWEKYFMGWLTPENLGTQGAKLTLYPNGTAQHNVYQINTSGKLESSMKEGLNYYIECRQQTGWDTYIPAEGMLIWKVNYSQSAWEGNTPNNTANNPKYTLIIPSGTKIGAKYGEQNVWPYSSTKSWSGVSGKPLKEITREGKNISLIYIEEPVEPVDPFDITYMANGAEFATVTTTTGKVVLPANEPAACEDGRVFVGWTATAGYESETTAPAFVKAGDAASEGAVFYAVYATKTEGAGTQSTTYTFTSKAWEDATNSWTSGQDGNSYDTNKNGVQVTEATTGANASTKASLSNVTKVVVTYCTNAAKGAGSIDVEVGNAKVSKEATKEGGLTLRNLEFEFANASGNVKITVNCTTNSIYVNSITVTVAGGAAYSDYSLVCGPAGPPASYTIRFFNNGEQIGEDQIVVEGQQPEVPANPAPSCEEYTFAGWWTEALAADNTTAKAWVTNFKATKDQDYYAIYSKTEEGAAPSTDYTKISALSDLTDGNYVVAGNSAYAMKSSILSSFYLATSSVSAVDNTISNPSADIIWQITRNGNAVSMYNESAGKYVCLFETGTYHNLRLQDEANWFTPTVSSGDWSFESNDCSGWYLVYTIYKSTTHEFAAKQNATTTIQLYKQAAGSTTYYSSIETCAATDFEQTVAQPAAIKAIRNGQLVILRGNAVYSVTGARIQ